MLDSQFEQLAQVNKKIFFAIVIWGMSCFSLADTDQADIEKVVVDSVLIEKALATYPRSELIESENGPVVDYPIAMGEMKKVRGLWAPERERRLDGELQRSTVQAPSGHSPQEVFDFYFSKIANLNARILYHCVARDCGESNAWANELFEIKQLYGLDQQQSYAAFELLDTQGRLHFINVYTVIRGNKRVYAHTEWLQTKLGKDNITPPSVDDIVQALSSKGYYFLLDITVSNGNVQFNEERLQTLVSAILMDRRSTLKVIAKNDGSSSNQNLAQQIVILLESRGVPSQRLSTANISPEEFLILPGATPESLVKIELISNN